MSTCLYTDPSEHGAHTAWLDAQVSGHHVAPNKDDKIGTTVSMDYCFLVAAEKTEDSCPVLVLYDDGLEAIGALPVTSTGVSEVVVDWCVAKLDRQATGASGYA